MRFSKSLLELEGGAATGRGAQGTRSALAGDTLICSGWGEEEKKPGERQEAAQWTVSGLTPPIVMQGCVAEWMRRKEADISQEDCLTVGWEPGAMEEMVLQPRLPHQGSGQQGGPSAPLKNSRLVPLRGQQGQRRLAGEKR